MKKTIILSIILMIIYSISLCFLSMAVTSFILDNKWEQYTQEITKQYKKEQEKSFAEGYWQGVFSLCLAVTDLNNTHCMLMVKRGYYRDLHSIPPPPNWNWSEVVNFGEVH